jgi:chromosomal replication initiation ATPase DnaA
MTADTIRAAVAEKHGLHPDDLLKGPGGKRPEIVNARDEAMVLCRERLKLSYPAIAKAFGGFDHSSVVVAIRRRGPLPETKRLTIREISRELIIIRRELKWLRESVEKQKSEKNGN